MAHSPTMCNSCGQSEGLYFWQCDVCRARLCQTCEEEKDASNHAIRVDADSLEEHNPDCPFCSYREPVVRSDQDSEIAQLYRYALEKLGVTHEALYDELFGVDDEDDDRPAPAAAGADD